MKTLALKLRKNLDAFLAKPDPAMVRVALCAGCRVGISGTLFALGEAREITKFVGSASYLELAPFKTAMMKAKGGGDEQQGLLLGLAENPLYDHDNNIEVIMLDHKHCHETNLSRGRSCKLYPNIQYFDFDQYFPNTPSQTEAAVTRRLRWNHPKRSWHFDCMIEQFKDLFYYGLLGYTETDYNLRAKIRHGLLSRNAAISQLLEARVGVTKSKETITGLMRQLRIEHLIPQVKQFYRASRFLSNNHEYRYRHETQYGGGPFSHGIRLARCTVNEPSPKSLISFPL